MNKFEVYIRDRHAAVNDELTDTERAVISRLDNGEDPSAELGRFAAARALAGWWHRVVTEIDHAGMDPVDALWRMRESARRVLTDQPMPQIACPFAYGFAVASIEAARRFHRDTAHMEPLATSVEKRSM
jgi:hypothetical protein